MEKKIYHSTNENCFKKILAEKSVKTCKSEFGKGKKPGTLGYGFYGFSDKDLCEQYGKEKIKNYKLLSCCISVSDQNILDFREEMQIKYYNSFKQLIINKPAYKKQESQYRNSNSQSSLEGALIELFILTLKKKKIDVYCLIAFTSTQVSTSEKSLLANGVEYCLKNKEVIKDMKEV